MIASMSLVFADEVTACLYHASRHNLAINLRPVIRGRCGRRAAVQPARSDPFLRAGRAGALHGALAAPATATIYVSPGAAVPLTLCLSRDIAGHEGWDRVYHGTSCEDAFSIAVTGFDSNRTRRGKAYGPGIYTTPSWSMAPHWASDEIEPLRLQDGRQLGCVLQCRVRPGSFTTHALTWDPPPVRLDVDHACCEYVVSNPQDILVEVLLLVALDLPACRGQCG